MGRKKKEVRAASEEAVKFVKDAVRNYRDMEEKCGEFERKHPSIIKRSKINPDSFVIGGRNIEETFVIPRAAPGDQEMMDAYLSDKEKVFLLERGISILDEGYRQLAEDFFIAKLSRAELEAKWHLSQATLTRQRNAIINNLALEVDDYMRWKTEYLFL